MGKKPVTNVMTTEEQPEPAIKSARILAPKLGADFFCTSRCLGGHHRETLAMVASARRFDSGIERQQVGLETMSSMMPIFSAMDFIAVTLSMQLYPLGQRPSQRRDGAIVTMPG